MATQDQLKNREEALANIQAGRPQETGIITPDALRGEALIDFKTFEDTPAPTPGIPEIPSQFQEQPATEKETETTGAIARIREQMGMLGGEAEARQTAQEKEGIKVKRETLERTRQRLTALETEAQQIPLQMQIQAEGRGITTGGLRPLQKARLRENAIAKLGARASFEAAAGNLALGLDFVERAVNAKFSPIKERINIELQNLDLISKLPDLTSSERKREEEQMTAKAIQMADIEQKENEELFKRSKVLEFIQAGVDDLTQREMERAETIEDVYRLASDAGLFEPTGKMLSVTEAKALGVPFGTTEEQAFGITPKKDPTANGLPNTTIRQVDALSSKFDASPIVKQFNEVQNKTQSIKAIVNSGVSGAGDLALVFEFMKSLDPTSVVRESEYDVASNAGNPFKRLAAKMGGYVSKGQMLPQSVRDEFARLSELKLKSIEKQYDNLFKETGRKINMKTGADDGTEYLTDYKGAFEGQEVETEDDTRILEEARAAGVSITEEEKPKGIVDKMGGFFNKFFGTQK